MQGQRQIGFPALRSPVAAAAALALLLLAAGLAYWGYAGYKKRQVQETVLALVADATVRLRDALKAREPGAGDLERLEVQFKALGASAQRLAALDAWRDPALSDAAQQYVDEAHALLRRAVALQRAHDATLAGTNALTEHMRAARGRSSDWIREAIGLRQQMDRDYFDYRLAEGGMRKSLQTLPESRGRLAPLAAATPLIEEGPIAEAGVRLKGQAERLAQQVEAARVLPLPR